jgi:hypothetical protein
MDFPHDRFRVDVDFQNSVSIINNSQTQQVMIVYGSSPAQESLRYGR